MTTATRAPISFTEVLDFYDNVMKPAQSGYRSVDKFYKKDYFGSLEDAKKTLGYVNDWRRQPIPTYKLKDKPKRKPATGAVNNRDYRYPSSTKEKVYDRRRRR